MMQNTNKLNVSFPDVCAAFSTLQLLFDSFFPIILAVCIDLSSVLWYVLIVVYIMYLDWEFAAVISLVYLHDVIIRFFF